MLLWIFFNDFEEVSEAMKMHFLVVSCKQCRCMYAYFCMHAVVHKNSFLMLMNVSWCRMNWLFFAGLAK